MMYFWQPLLLNRDLTFQMQIQFSLMMLTTLACQNCINSGEESDVRIRKLFVTSLHLRLAHLRMKPGEGSKQLKSFRNLAADLILLCRILTSGDRETFLAVNRVVLLLMWDLRLISGY